MNDTYGHTNIDIRFTRIQSTLCEQGHLIKVLKDLDYDLLMNLALGNECVIVDRSSRGNHWLGLSRAQWMGGNWIKYVLNRIWLNRRKRFFKNGKQHSNPVELTPYFDKKFRELEHKKEPYKKIKYFRKFLDTDEIHLYFLGGPSLLDGNTEKFREIITQFNKGSIYAHTTFLS